MRPMKAKRAICIPSRERHEVLSKRKSHTLEYAQYSGYQVFVFVRRKEYNAYFDFIENKDYANTMLIAVDNSIDTIAKTYDRICHSLWISNYSQAIIMDDDLIFAERLDYDIKKLTAVPYDRFHRIANDLFQAIVEPNVVMAGIAPRNGAIAHKKIKKYNQKIHACLAINVGPLRNFNWEWDYDSMFDHNMTLNLLTDGYSNVMLTEYTHDDILKYNNIGGCAAYRDPKDRKEAAKVLAKKFPQAVYLRDSGATFTMKKSFGDKRIIRYENVNSK